jgi:hypothetical protein
METNHIQQIVPILLGFTILGNLSQCIPNLNGNKSHNELLQLLFVHFWLLPFLETLESATKFWVLIL